MGIHRNIPVYSTAFLKSPIIVGLLKPCIYLPIHLISDYNESDMRYMLLHELQHYKHKDAVASYLMNLAGVVYWINPLVWYALKEMRNDREVAIEVCSFSKIAGFTGTRCGYTVVPQALAGGKLNKMWLRRQTTKFNGVAYVVQRGAEAVFTDEGMKEIQQNLDYYRANAAVIAAALDEAGVWYCGGKNSPYIWLRCPNEMGSWEFFDWLLEHAHVVGTPGEGFGPCGKGYFRLTAFGDAERTKEAAARIKAALATL